MSNHTTQPTKEANGKTSKNLGLVRTEPCRYFDAYAEARREKK